MNKLHYGSFDECDLPTLEEAGYWYSEATGKWYVKSKPRKSEFVKGMTVYSWELITSGSDIELLEGGLDPRLFDEIEHE